MKNKLYIVITVILITGCATTSPMPETHYKEISSFAANLHQCFEKDYISPQLYADTKNAVSYTLNTWSYDENKLKSMADDVYRQINPDQRICRQVEAAAYQLLSRNNQHRVDQRQNQTDINDALKEINKNKPIYCNTIGTMTLCN